MVSEHPHATDFGVHPGVDTRVLAHSHNRTGIMILHHDTFGGEIHGFPVDLPFFQYDTGSKPEKKIEKSNP